MPALLPVQCNTRERMRHCLVSSRVALAYMFFLPKAEPHNGLAQRYLALAQWKQLWLAC